MSGARAGEQDLAVVGGRRWPRRLLAALVVIVLLVVFLGSALTSEWFSEYPTGGCKGVGIAGAILSEVPENERPERHATPEEALAAVLARTAPSLNGETFPADGWQEYRGRWVRDLHDGTYLEIGVGDGEYGWSVGGDYVICRR